MICANSTATPITARFFLFESGGGCALVDNEEFSLAPGTLLVVPANCLYQLRLSSDSDGLMFAGSELFLRTKVAQALFTTPAAFCESYYSPAAHQELAGQHREEQRKQVFAEIYAAAKRFGLGCDAAVMGYIFVLMTEDTIPNRLSGIKPTPSWTHRAMVWCTSIKSWWKSTSGSIFPLKIIAGCWG